VCVCSAEDAGTFTCVAENEAGQDTMDVQLIVHGLYTHTHTHTDGHTRDIMDVQLIVHGVSSACIYIRYAFSAFTLLVGRQEEHPACKN